ncbi:NnrU family protein [Salibaculum sp.]|uniref:NnrU family protein n=1 Tax=Salibaculum sp. TaxID=2855480 RepID=UPI002B478856|nr:NnrU family protein [Salibaculum sp.]HKL69325.1 NnrU family protein [Salibaculum sp.]
MGWPGFAAVFASFFLTHSIPVRPAVKARLVAVLGARGFGLAYSALSLAMLTALIRAAGSAPHLTLWYQAGWHRPVAHLGMLAVCLILALSIARPNPFSFGGSGNDTFDPDRAGLVRWTRHPILLALALWAGVHLLPNGDLAHVILFGVLGGFAIAGQTLIDRRKRRDLGPARWDTLNAARKAAPRLQRPRCWPEAIMRCLVGLVAFVALILAHPQAIGVAVI